MKNEKENDAASMHLVSDATQEIGKKFSATKSVMMGCVKGGITD